MTEHCPFCLEAIAPDSPSCRWCGEPLTPEAELQQAPPELVARKRALVKARGKANEAFVGALISPVCCWIVMAPVSVAYGFWALHVFKKHNEKPPWQAIAAVVIGLLVLCGCGALMVLNVVATMAQVR